MRFRIQPGAGKKLLGSFARDLLFLAGLAFLVGLTAGVAIILLVLR